MTCISGVTQKKGTNETLVNIEQEIIMERDSSFIRQGVR